MVPKELISSPAAEAVLNAIPHPAMLVNSRRNIMAANTYAIESGAEVGEFCWQTFGQSAFLSEEHRALADKDPRTRGIKCTFCRADECLNNLSEENDPSVKAFNKVLDTYWVGINHDVYLHYAIDVTEYEKTKEARINAEMTLRMILDSTAEGVYGLDHNGCCTFVNKRCLELTGYKSDGELLGRNMHEMLFKPANNTAAVHTYDCVINSFFHSNHDHLNKDEVIMWRADGTRFFAECSVQKVLGKIRNLSAVVTFRDISEQKQNILNNIEKQYYLSKAQEMGKIGTWELDLVNNVLKWTPQNYKIFGVSEGTSMDYETFLECVHPEDRDYVHRKWSAALDGEPYDIEHRLLVGGQVEWVREKAEVSFDKAGKAQLAIGFTQNITRNKELEEKLVDIVQQLQEKTDEQERFLYTVSHDLKNPLITISGFAGMLREDLQFCEDVGLLSKLETINNATMRMRQLIDELLEFSVIGKKPLQLESVDPEKMIKQAIDNLSGTLEYYSATVEVVSRFPAVKADEKKVLQVLENLIANAAKYASKEPDGAKIKIGARIDKAEVVYYVQDNGIGITKDGLDKVFEVFARLDKTFEGTGIGLAITKRIIERHGGKVWAESDGLGKGATFCFTLPQDNIS